MSTQRNKPIELTRRQLRMAIADLQGWTLDDENAHGPRYWRHGEFKYTVIPDPTSEGEAALDLLEEVGDWTSIERDLEIGETYCVTHFGAPGDFYPWADTIPLAICLAYYEFKTGVRVKLLEEGA